MLVRLVRSAAFAIALCAAPVAIIVSSGSAHAAAQQAVSAKVGVPLKAALELAKVGKFKEALAKANEAELVEGRTPFDNLKIAEVKVYIYGQLKDYANAARSIEQILATGLVTGDQKKSYRKQMVLLYFRGGNNARGVETAKSYIADYGADDELLLQIASSSYQSHDYASSASAAERLVHAAEEAGRRPDEPALNLLIASLFQLHKLEDYYAAVEKRVAYYPKAEYWRELLEIAPRRSGFNQKYVADLFVLRFTLHAIAKGDDYVEMAEVSLQQNFPAYAKLALDAAYKDKLIDDGKNGRNKRLLALAQKRYAEEKITDKDEADARGQATGDSLVRVAAVVASYGEYPRAIKLFKEGIAKGGLTAPNETKLRYGVTQIRGGDAHAGIETLKGIKAKDGTGDLARYWSLHARQI